MARFGEILWYQNLDGLGSFGPKQSIWSDMKDGQTAVAADLDGDGDLDVLSASRIYDEKVAWYENTDGAGTFGPQQVIYHDPATRPETAIASDLDGDGDLDVVMGSFYQSEIAWFENLGGVGSFGAKQVIPTDIGNPPPLGHGLRSVVAADLDGDGDADLLSAWQNDHAIAWSENSDGQGTFVLRRNITSAADGAQDAVAADFDGDGDLDALSASDTDDKIAWYKNTDSDPLDPDTDDDGLTDHQEVFATGTDPRDADIDRDGLSDLYEAGTSFTDPYARDTDGDDLDDAFEIFTAGTDARDADSDDDGLLDGFEWSHGFDPLVAGEQSQDPDLDGLDNLAEQSYGTDPHDPDSDADGVTDGIEVAEGTDPTDPADTPSLPTDVPAAGPLGRGVLALLLLAGLSLGRAERRLR